MLPEAVSRATPDTGIGGDAVALLRDLLRVDTTNPPGNEGAAAELLERFLAGAGLATQVLHSPSGRPTIVGRLAGPTDAPALVLLSHTDVVSVEREHWTQDPFGGEIVDGRLYGRGALDMKGIAALHAVAAAHVARLPGQPARELIFCSVADEEAGSAEGARWLLDAHPELVGFAPGRPAPEVLCEGGFGLSGLTPRPILPIVLGEKAALWVRLRAQAPPGHGSMPGPRVAVRALAETVAELTRPRPRRVEPVVAALLAEVAPTLPARQRLQLRALAGGTGGAVARLSSPRAAPPILDALLRDTVAATSLRGGEKVNVLPSSAQATLDCRLLPSTDVARFADGLRRVAARRGVEVEIDSQGAGPVTEPGPLYEVLRRASAALPERPVVVPALTPAFTDLRLFRARGARGYGWVPLTLSAAQWQTIHGHDEHVDVAPFARAAEVMTAVVAEALGAPMASARTPRSQSAQEATPCPR
jgi:acetylornithine deacetylase/succinyl-diaminopimelate desuccinylase-like protein